MNTIKKTTLFLLFLLFTISAFAAPQISRFTPPSELFKSKKELPIISRFLPDQRFDIQSTIIPDSEKEKITKVVFYLDDVELKLPVTIKYCDTGCVTKVPKNTAIATIRAFSTIKPGKHLLKVIASQSDGQNTSAFTNFEIVELVNGGKKVKNIIILIGDGMGSAQRTAARIVSGGYAQGMTIKPLAMDTFPVTGLVKTASLNSLITDSAPGMSSYVTGNKADNNEEGVFPDDTIDVFDNPRVEYLSEYLFRTQGKALGIVTTADVFDATPAANAVHTSDRGAGTGIVDQYLDDRKLTGLTVLMGGGRKWFLPSTTPGSARTEKNDYQFSMTSPHTAEIVKRWGASEGKLDKDRDLIADFKAAGFNYAPDKKTLDTLSSANTSKLLGLFSYSNMNVALDKIDGRRNKKNGITGRVVDDYGFPDQPMLEEMTEKALEILAKEQKGFVLMVEGASIDKQAHNMDTERWILDTIEFDHAVKVAQNFALKNKDTLVIVTADHECAGVALIGGSVVSHTRLQELVKVGGAENIRDKVVGIYEKAGFPAYKTANDNYPETTDIDFRLIVGYGANSDRHEDWMTNQLPLQDVQQPFVATAPLNVYPKNTLSRDEGGKFLVTGQVPGTQAVHTAVDVPISAMGPGAINFTGVLDNTDVFFILGQSAVKGVIAPKNIQ
jgi:alkaline phosphatase